MLLLDSRYGEDRVYIIGQMGHTGQLTATAEWGEPVECMTLLQPAEGARCHC